MSKTSYSGPRNIYTNQPELWAEAQRLAAARGISMSELIHKLLEAYIRVASKS